jgi:hypothetical protein
MHLGYIDSASDTEWIWIFTYVFLGILTIPFLLYYGVLTLVNESGLIPSSEPTVLCSVSSPKTFMYSVVTSCMYIATLVITTVIMFMRIVPSLIQQARERSYTV